MASHFRWYPSSDEMVVPFMAQYAFPSQANKSVKMTPRIPPKNGFVFTPGNVMRLEFPAQGYVNTMNTSLSFDVSLVVPNAGFENSAGTQSGRECLVRFQNNIQSIFSRVRLLYGANPLEDIINYNVIVRNLTEWTAGNPSMCIDQGTITDGIGNNTVGYGAAPTSGFSVMNTRANFIQGAAFDRDGTQQMDSSVGRGLSGFAGAAPAGVLNTDPFPASLGSPLAPATVPSIVVTRRYQVQLALGLMTQEKLLPVKYMASQLAIEITLETPANCIVAFMRTATADAPGYIDGWQNRLTYCVHNVNLIPEILEFDSSYDTAFLQGLQNGGVPIQFCSWHTFIFSSATASNVNLLINERSRSVKSIYTVQRKAQPDITSDNGATFFDTSITNEGGTLQNYQYRIGGRYFPAAPVQCSTNTGSAVTNGGAEAYIELAKALNILGDYRLSTACNITRWAYPAGAIEGADPGARQLQDKDFSSSIRTVSPFTGIATYVPTGAGGDCGSQCFAAAISLETSNGMEISGLNAEEQSDISFLCSWKAGQVTASSVPSSLECYVYYDAMILLEMNNVVKLIQ